jgi:hypothetical protein
VKPNIREYLYVDTPRVRTLLAQLSSGVPEERRSERTKQWSASLSGIDGPGHDQRTGEHEVRSLADLHVAMLEEVAEYAKMLLDVSEISKKPKNWHRERIHKALRPSSLIRVTGPTAIIYPASFAAAASAFDEFDDDKSFSIDLGKIVRSMFGDHLTLRVYPCGEEEWNCQYSGVVADPGGYLAGEKSVLFSRLGADPQEWTTVATISRIPRRAAAASDSQFERVVETLQNSFTADQLDRQILEKMIQEASREMERKGLSEAPSWPAISVIPLAVYRDIQPSHITPDLEIDD